MRETRKGAAGLATLVGAALLSCVLMATDPVAEQFWPQWRGPYAVLATNTLDDGFDASAALVDDHIFLRGYRYLYDIAEP